MKKLILLSLVLIIFTGCSIPVSTKQCKNMCEENGGQVLTLTKQGCTCKYMGEEIKYPR